MFDNIALKQCYRAYFYDMFLLRCHCSVIIRFTQKSVKFGTFPIYSRYDKNPCFLCKLTNHLLDFNLLSSICRDIPNASVMLNVVLAYYSLIKSGTQKSVKFGTFPIYIVDMPKTRVFCVPHLVILLASSTYDQSGFY